MIPVIGIETHVELKTSSKMHCGCKASHFQVKPNIHTCPVCLGLPGSLPVPNKKAIDWCLKIGLALGCQINPESKFDRKNYFYPDLPKGFQISQYDMPFCKQGKIEVATENSSLKTIRINRVHLEEDTAKLLHRTLEGTKVSLIDFNRSGVPLVEIVTEPDIQDSDQAVAYLKKLQQTIRYLGVSNCDMEKGSMRCEVNISLASPGLNLKQGMPKYKVEVKNINSFKFVKKAIEYEIKRQEGILKKGQTPPQETRGFDENRGVTYSQRGKEEAHDYRYFPEPDIPPLKVSHLKHKIMASLPELPDKKEQRFIKKYGLSKHYASLLLKKKNIAKYFEQTVKAGGDPLEISKLIVNKRIELGKYSPKALLEHLKKQRGETLSDKTELENIIAKIIKQNPKPVTDFKKGKAEALGFLMGQVMRETKGKAEAAIARKLLLEKLS